MEWQTNGRDREGIVYAYVSSTQYLIYGKMVKCDWWRFRNNIHLPAEIRRQDKTKACYDISSLTLCVNSPHEARASWFFALNTAKVCS